jgi:DNA-binding CsgD family transcriptional regulator
VVEPSAFNRLTGRQKQCLRLVASPATSKQIARELGISSHTVDEHVREAMATLGAADRMEAARLLLAHEGGRTPQTLSSQAVGVEPIAAAPATSLASDRDAAPGLPFPLPFPTRGRPINDLDRTARLVWIGAVLIGLILAASLFISLAVRISHAT